MVPRPRVAVYIRKIEDTLIIALTNREAETIRLSANREYIQHFVL